MTGLREAKEAILAANSIAIAGHINPDGDAIGSLLSLGLGLKSLGKRVYMLSSDGVPARYRILPGASLIVRKVDKKVDLAISVDCGSKEMVGGAFETFERAGRILEIDHHEFREQFGDIVLLDIKAGSVGELVYQLLRELKVDITKNIAQNILTSIVVETDSFRLPNVRSLTFKICGDLLKKRADFYKLTDMIYWSRTKEGVILSGICLSRCKFIKADKIVWSLMKEEDFDRINGKDEDIDAVIDEMCTVRGIRIAVLFREKSREWLRVSLRSKNSTNVGRLAEKYGGGGHFNSAGCTIRNTRRNMKDFLNQAKKML